MEFLHRMHPVHMRALIFRFGVFKNHNLMDPFLVPLSVQFWDLLIHTL